MVFLVKLFSTTAWLLLLTLTAVTLLSFGPHFEFREERVATVMIGSKVAYYDATVAGNLIPLLSGYPGEKSIPARIGVRVNCADATATNSELCFTVGSLSTSPVNNSQCWPCEALVSPNGWISEKEFSFNVKALRLSLGVPDLARGLLQGMQDYLLIVVHTYGIFSEGLVALSLSIIAWFAAQTIHSGSPWRVILLCVALSAGWASAAAYLVHACVHTWLALSSGVFALIQLARNLVVSRSLKIVYVWLGPTVGSFIGERLALSTGFLEVCPAEDVLSPEPVGAIVGAASALHKALAAYGDPNGKESVLNLAAPYTECLGMSDAGSGIVQLGFKMDGQFTHVGFGTRVTFSGFDGLMAPGHVFRGDTGIFSYSPSLWVKKGDKIHQVEKCDVVRFAGSEGLDVECVRLPAYVFSMLGVRSRKIASPPNSFMAVIYAPLNPKQTTSFAGSRWYRQRSRITRPKTKFILTHSFDTIPGMSGLPICNTTGHVVGMHSRGSARKPEADGALPGDSLAFAGLNVALRADIFSRFARAKSIVDNSSPVTSAGNAIAPASKLAKGKSLNGRPEGKPLEGHPESSLLSYDDDALFLRIQEWEDRLGDDGENFFDLTYEEDEYQYREDMRREEAQAVEDTIAGLEEADMRNAGFYRSDLREESWADNDYWDREAGYSNSSWNDWEAKTPSVVSEQQIPLPASIPGSSVVDDVAAPETDQDFRMGGSLRPPKKSLTPEDETPSHSSILSGTPMATSISPSRSTRRVSDSVSLEDATSTSHPGNRKKARPVRPLEASTRSSMVSKEPTDGLSEAPTPNPKASIIRLRFTTRPTGLGYDLATDSLTADEIKLLIASLARKMQKLRDSSQKNSKTSASPKSTPSGSGKGSAGRQTNISQPTKPRKGPNSTGTPASPKKESSKKKGSSGDT
jgi:hypothetical protein